MLYIMCFVDLVEEGSDCFDVVGVEYVKEVYMNMFDCCFDIVDKIMFCNGMLCFGMLVNVVSIIVGGK